MSEFPKGSYIVRDGERRKILGEVGDIRFVSANSEYGEKWETVAMFYNHIAELKDDGWKPEGEKWQPKIGETYASVHVSHDSVDVEDHVWSGGSIDLGRLALGNVYPVGQGEAAAERVRKTLKEE